MSAARYIHRDVSTRDFLTQARFVGIELGLSARLDDPLPANTDFTEVEDKEIQSQVLLTVTE